MQGTKATRTQGICEKKIGKIKLIKEREQQTINQEDSR